MTVDKQTKVGDFIQFPLDYTDEKCLTEHGLTMDQYDDVHGYLDENHINMLDFLFKASRGHPNRIAKFEDSKRLTLETIAKIKKITEEAERK